jgi:hypothetical protein
LVLDDDLRAWLRRHRVSDKSDHPGIVA